MNNNNNEKSVFFKIKVNNKVTLIKKKNHINSFSNIILKKYCLTYFVVLLEFISLQSPLYI